MLSNTEFIVFKLFRFEAMDGDRVQCGTLSYPGVLPLGPAHGPLFVKAAPLFSNFTSLIAKNI